MTDRIEQGPRQVIWKLNLVGFAAVALLLGVIGGWAATSHIAGAVIALGSIVPESNVKKVQHPTGGVVGQIFVREGSRVEEDQILMRLDDTVTRSTLGVIRSQLDELTAREARLLTELTEGQVVTFPTEFVNRASERGVGIAIAGEENLFDARRRGRTGQRSQLRERITQTQEEIAGLTAQLRAKESEIKFISEELVGVGHLYRQNLVSIQRFMALQREQARLQGEQGQLIAEIARARARISESELQILQLDRDFRTEVLKDLREAQGKIAELKERVTGAEDQLKRIDIRATATGIVHQLAVHTVGGVIANGETIMQIVPIADRLLVEAKVGPQDVDQITRGAKTMVRIMAGNQRILPVIHGEVVLIGAELTREKEQPNQGFYLVRVSIPADEVQRLDELKLVPGMSAEVFIQTRERTPLEYLMKPLYEQIARAFRER